MNKPTDEELERMAYLAERPIGCGKEGRIATNRALHDAGIAHGWREAIEALRAHVASASGTSRPSYLVLDLERIAKERGYV